METPFRFLPPNTPPRPNATPLISSPPAAPRPIASPFIVPVICSPGTHRVKLRPFTSSKQSSLQLNRRPSWRAELPKLMPYPLAGISRDQCEQGEPVPAATIDGKRRSERAQCLKCDMRRTRGFEFGNAGHMNQQRRFTFLTYRTPRTDTREARKVLPRHICYFPVSASYTSPISFRVLSSSRMSRRLKSSGINSLSFIPSRRQRVTSSAS